MCAFSSIDGNLYVVNYKEIDNSKIVKGPDGKTEYSTPKLLFKYFIGQGISSPIIIDNKIVACSSSGIYLFEFKKINGKLEFKLLCYKSHSELR